MLNRLYKNRLPEIVLRSGKNVLAIKRTGVFSYEYAVYHRYGRDWLQSTPFSKDKAQQMRTFNLYANNEKRLNAMFPVVKTVEPKRAVRSNRRVMVTEQNINPYLSLIRQYGA